ncbi:MAG: glycosyltransferase [Sphingomonadaceae bacterium]
MKIVDVCAFYAPQGGGVRTYINRKLAIGAAMGHEIVVIAPGTDDSVEVREGGGRIIYTASPPLIFDRRYRYFDNPAAVHRILDAEKPDFVEGSSPWRTSTIVAEWNGSAPRALFMHADPLAIYAYRWFDRVHSRETIDRNFAMFWRHLRRLGQRYDSIICANPSFTGRLTEGGVANVETIPMGVDPGIFSPSLRDEAVRAELLARCALPPEATLLLGVGRMMAEKRWPMIVDACLAASHHRSLGLVIVGDGRDRDKIVRHIGGNPHIHLLAPIRDRALLAKVMASADALVHGSSSETYGLVVAEAAASGLPLIVPDEGGAAFLVSAETGEQYAAGDPVALCDAINRLLDRDRSALSTAAARAATDVMTIDSHFETLFAHYTSISHGQKRAA